MIKELTIKNFKSIKETHVSFSPQMNLLVGLNGAGKTNLLKAISLIRNLATGELLNEATKEMMLVPSELFFQQDSSQDIFLSIVIENQDKNYFFELLIENSNDSKLSTISPLKIKQEKLSESSKDNPSDKKIIYKREAGNVVKNEEEVGIPIQVANNQSVSGIYQEPSIVTFKEAIKNINIIDTDMVNTSKQGRFVRDNDPTNLTSLIVKLKHEDSERFKTFESVLKKLLPSLSSITDFSTAENSTAENNKFYLVLFEQFKLAGKLSFKSLSDGDIRTLMIILNTVIPDENSTLIIEEVENALHPHRVKSIIEHLKRVCYINNLQVILTTHNPLIIDTVSPEEIIYVQRRNGSGSQFVQLKEAKYTSKIQEVLKDGGNLTDFIESIVS